MNSMIKSEKIGFILNECKCLNTIRFLYSVKVLYDSLVMCYLYSINVMRL